MAYKIKRDMRLDHGWSWIVLFSAFLIMVLSQGLSLSLTVYLEELKLEFDVGSREAGMFAGTCLAFTTLTSPVASYVCNKIGFRATFILSGLITALSVILSSVTTSFVQMFCSTTLTGIGLSFAYTPCSVIMGFYFHKRYVLANGFVFAGVYAGIFAFPVLFEYLKSMYTWRVCYRLIGAISLHICVAGTLVMPIRRRVQQTTTVVKERENGDQQTTSRRSSVKYKLVGGKTIVCSNDPLFEVSIPHRQTGEHEKIVAKENFEKTLLFVETSICPEDHPDDVSVVRHDNESFYKNVAKYDVKRTDLFIESHTCSEDPPNEAIIANVAIKNVEGRDGPPDEVCMAHQPADECYEIIANVDKVDVGRTSMFVKTGICIQDPPDKVSMAHLPVDECYEKDVAKKDVGRLEMLVKTVNSSENSPDQFSVEHQPSDDFFDQDISKERTDVFVCKSVSCWTRLSKITEVFELRLFLSIDFVIMFIIMYVFSVGYMGTIVHFVARSGWVGFTSTQSGFLLSLMGIGGVFSRITHGVFVDKMLMKATHMYFLSLLSSGIFVLSLTFVSSYMWNQVISIFIGISSGTLAPLTPVIMKNIVGLERFNSAFGLSLVAYGLADFTGSLFTSWIYDLTENYDKAFYMTSACLLSASFLMIIAMKKQ
ncbi:uncharacterized protein LOC117107878 [Anneissia japonica]|uniref:uncharacterized protein LOC117107878 n=1 Tax=Anneissia japonica TaxID=1529436 RepID=UPI00142580E6|nr:uncharacterized protein LOC117107878 [Anneissia japonica]